jgi:TolB protein
VADRDGSNAGRLVETPGVDSDPRWSPDGRAVIFTTAAGASNQDVVLIDVDDPELETLADGPGYEYAPSFTPDGDEVLFVRDGSVFAIGLDGSHERRLTDGPSDVNPETSPDGRRLAFIHDGSLFVAAADGSSPTCVMTNQSISGGPRWRP